jgi:eukaryotic-like serine/threonine-protein kinase
MIASHSNELATTLSVLNEVTRPFGAGDGGSRLQLSPGDLVGRYQLLQLIGSGGMGRVWVAREAKAPARSKLYAVKTALAEGAANKDFWKVMLDEAQIASQIQHPNVCRIHSFDQQGDLSYLVMDYCDGATLRQLLDAVPDHRLPYAVAARICASALAGLHAAHDLRDENGEELGVVHRDVSPQNLLLSRQGHVSLIDFGVAKSRGQIHAPTQTGEVKGKLSYMAPEQVTSKFVDRRADVFAMGCVLYEASVGTRPFHGGDALATMYQLLEQPLKKPSELVADFPEELETIIVRALQRNLDERFQTADAMERALQGFLARSGGVTSDSEVQKILAQYLGEPLEARAKELESLASTLRDRPRPTKPPPAPLPSDTPTPTSHTTSQVVPSPAPVWPKLAAGVSVALALIVGTVWLQRAPEALPEREPAASISPATVEPAATKTPTAAAKVSITLRTLPADGRIAVDGGRELTSPVTLEVEADEAVHRVVARSPGYREQVRELAFDRSQELVLELEKAPRTSGPARVNRPAPGPVVRQPEPKSAPLNDAPVVMKKPPRQLDNDNPFASP